MDTLTVEMDADGLGYQYHGVHVSGFTSPELAAAHGAVFAACIDRRQPAPEVLAALHAAKVEELRRLLAEAVVAKAREALTAHWDNFLRPFLDRVAAALRPVLEAWAEAARSIAGVLAPLHATQARRARISRRWSDPQARWAMWDRKSDREGKAWTRTEVRPRQG